MEVKDIVLAIIMVIGGLAFFLYGMSVMSSGLEKMAGGKMEQALKKLTSNWWLSLILGTGITIVLQSSSSLTVMLVGLVNCGVMEVAQTVVVIIGANIGKTFTTWLLCLMGVDTEGPLWLSLLNPEYFSLIFALIGAVLMMAKGAPNSRKKDIGSIMVGFAVLMYGMVLMKDAVEPLKDSPDFQQLLTKFDNPILGVLVGTVVTGVIQSSAASIGILQTLAENTGTITFGMAIPIIMGQNIGTCVTALISSFGVNRNAKKVAVIHIAFNVIGTVIFLTVYEILDMIFHFAFSDWIINSVGIAIVHTVFNVATTILLLPFSKGLEKIANLVLPDKAGENEGEEKHKHHTLLDKRLLTTPSVAVAECENASQRMSLLAMETVLMSISLISNYDEKVVKKVYKNEEKLDNYEDRIGSTLVQLTSMALSERDSQVSTRVLRAIGDFERLGDHAINIAQSAEEIHNNDLHFSENAQKEMQVLTDAITEILQNTHDVYKSLDEKKAVNIEPLEQVIDYLTRDIKANHVKRLQKGTCTIETGFVLADILNNYERVSDHCSNIAVSVIETSHNMFETHNYLSKVKFGNKNFNDNFEKFSEKYKLPTAL
ncbi:MAG: Na/Pi cotransporter family protein [Oscillospiraceae bacterium]|nr:Na/Pi cotransporter family protein [Oscillospiraceae bacterium]